MRNLPEGYVYERYKDGDFEIEIEGPQCEVSRIMDLTLHLIRQDVPLLTETHIWEHGRMKTVVRLINHD
jgi:hypothetical protein